MGIVVEAMHVGLGKRVCVKLLRRELTEDAGIVERFRIEAQALAALGGGNHPNLVHVTDFGVTADRRWFLVMERLNGRTLKDEIETRGALPWREAVGLTLQLLAGLSVAHEQGVVHRDIKPANLFLVDGSSTADARVLKILDFGIAKILKGGDGLALAAPPVETEPGVAIGTPRYLSPEQAFGKTVDHRADLYATGLVLYELIAGRGPFHHHIAIQKIYEAQALEVPEPPSKWVAEEISPALDRIVLQLLEKRPEKRVPSATLAADALRALLDAPPRRASVPTEIVQTPTAAHAGTEVMEVATEVMPIDRQSPKVRPKGPLTAPLEVPPVHGSLPRLTEKLVPVRAPSVPRNARVQSAEAGAPTLFGRPPQHWVAFALVVVSTIVVFCLAAWLLLGRSLAARSP